MKGMLQGYQLLLDKPLSMASQTYELELELELELILFHLKNMEQCNTTSFI